MDRQIFQPLDIGTPIRIYWEGGGYYRRRGAAFYLPGNAPGLYKLTAWSSEFPSSALFLSGHYLLEHIAFQ